MLNKIFDEIIVLSGEYNYGQWRKLNKIFIDKNIYITRIEKYKPTERKVLIDAYPCQLDTNLPESFYQDNLTLLKVLNYIDMTNAKKILVLDEGISFINGFDQELSNQYDNISKLYWDMWILGADNYNKNIKSHFNNILPSKDINGIFAFALNIKNYNNILIYMKYLCKRNLAIRDIMENYMSSRTPYISYISKIKIFNR